MGKEQVNFLVEQKVMKMVVWVIHWQLNLIKKDTWFIFGKRVWQGRILSPCLFNLYAEYIIQNARLDEAQAGIKIAGRKINKLRYADDTTLVAGSELELKSLLMKVKEESEKAGLKLNIQKMSILASSPITSCPEGQFDHRDWYA